MSRDLPWAGAWRKLGPEDGMGIVGGISIVSGRGDRGGAARPTPAATATQGAASEKLGVVAEQLAPRTPTSEPDARPNGRVRLPRGG